MLKHFLNLQRKSFFRAASFKTNLIFKFFMGFMALYFMVVFLSMGVGAFYLLENSGLGDPLKIVNQFLIYYLAIDLAFRYAVQKMPITNIKPLLYLPFKKAQVVRYSLGKTVVSFFNLAHAFFFVPFSIVLLIEGYSPLGVIGWHLGIMALFYCNNFLNVLLNNKDSILIPLAVVFAILGISQYYDYFDITQYTAFFFDALYDVPWMAILPWALLVGLYTAAFNYFKKHMYLDAGLAQKHAVAKTEDFTWLDRFGNLGLFLKNDIKLIKRNKRSKTTVLTSVFFLFYGLLFFTGAIETYEGPVWKIFAGIFISGGFLFTFGQFVPSWDSSYYPLMMSQNIRYKDYLNSKWYLIIIATLISTVLASPYLYFGWGAYVAVLVGAVYNMGVNSYLVLWGGAYIKTPIDLTSNKKAFGDKQSFNLKTMLLTIPKLLLPLLIYGLGHYLLNPTAGYIFVALTGVAGFAFKNIVFKQIEKVYKKEKYKTLLAYKQTS
ncbi:hypothetical protein SAMN05421636_101444 [Pricia antarctica]|uniref:ABC-2 type transport system permease protein n=1 Tax=Pricia antarctica TaxID=641691 RepID=A0A1G6WW09_9FLAO|nr:DUF5687 family protein [Pricia antarctica]SDD69979.1 hypothetical protein SAMN05421636_101444 [Pricia antarctica]